MELFVPSKHNAANGDPTESAAMPRLRRAPQHRDTPNIKLISPDLTKTLVLGVGEENYLLSLRKFAESKRLPELQCKVFPLKHGGNVRYYSYIQVGDISCNTVDSGCMTATAAIQLAAKRVLHELSSDECAPASSGATFTQLALCRILQLVNSHPGGLWLKNIPSEYLRVYKESVPEGWKDAVCKCPLLFKEEISDHMTIVTFSDKIWTPSLAPASADKKSATVKLPKGHTWNVHVTLVLTASRIYVNLIGEDLSDELVELHIMMDNFYKRSKVPPVRSPQEGNFYAAPINSEWHRVCLKKVTGPMRGILQLIDTGGEVEGELNMIWELKPIFASLPPQAVLCRLAGLEGFAEDMSLKEHISARITKKQFVAVVLSRTPCVTVMLYDTSKEEIINININMAKSISDTARFPKLQVGVRQTAYVSYVCPKEGTLYLTLEHKKYIHYMNIMFNYLMTTDNERPNIVRPSFPVDQGKMYLVSESEGSSWLRAKAKRSSQSKVEVQCIDYGKHVIVHPMQLVVLDNLSPALVNIPSQAVQVKLSLVEMTHETAGLLKEMVENHYLVVEMVDAGGDGIPVVNMYYKPQNKTDNLRCINTLLQGGAVTSNLSASPNRMPFTLTRKPGMSDEQFSTLCTLITQMYESYSVPLGVSVTTHSDVGVSLNTAAMENLTLDNRPNKSTTAQNLGNVLLNSILSSKSVQDPFLRKETINTAVKTQESHHCPEPKPLPLPPVGGTFDIMVFSAVDPGNFVVQALTYRHKLCELMCRMLACYGSRPKPEDSSQLDLNTAAKTKETLAAYHAGHWYRVNVKQSMNDEVLSVYFCDYGNVEFVVKSKIRTLRDEFKLLPYQAVRARMYNLSCKSGEWSQHDKEIFKSRVEERRFKCKVRGICADPVDCSQVMLEVELNDTSVTEHSSVHDQLMQQLTDAR